MFLAESREHLQELNLAVVRIEEAPDDRETRRRDLPRRPLPEGHERDDGLRAASRALTHKMEDVFELLRQRARRARPRGDRRAARVPRRAARRRRRDRRRRRGALDPAGWSPASRACRATHAATERRRTRRRGAVGRAARRRPAASLHVPAELAGRRADAVRARLTWCWPRAGEHGERLRSSARPRTTSTASTAASIEAWLATEHEAAAASRPRATSPDVARRRGRSTRRRARRRGRAAAAPSAAAAAARPPGTRATTSTVRVDAERLDQLMHLMGELVVAPHAVEALAAQARACPGLAEADAGPDAQLAGAAGDGHAGADDPGRGRVHAASRGSSATSPRSSTSRSTWCSPAGRPSSTARSSTRSATRWCTWSATRSTTRWRRPTSGVAAGKPADRPAGDRRPPRGRQRRHHRVATTAAASTRPGSPGGPPSAA